MGDSVDIQYISLGIAVLNLLGIGGGIKGIWKWARSIDERLTIIETTCKVKSEIGECR